MISIFPLQTNYFADFVDTSFTKSARSLIKKSLPSILTAVDTETKEYATMGWRSRKTSHACEITYFGHQRDDLLIEVSKSLILSSILEGRKRIEIYNEFEDINQVFEKAGFINEGFHPKFTKDFLDVTVFGFVPAIDGLPSLSSETFANFVISNDVLIYRNKNFDLYKKDKDWDRLSNSKLTFGEELNREISEIESTASINILNIPKWSGDSNKSDISWKPEDFYVNNK